MNLQRIPMRVLALNCVLAASFVAGAVRAGEEKKEEPKKPPTVKLDAKAVALLRGCIDYINKTTSYSTTLTYSQKAVVGLGKPQESTSKYDITVQRPNKLAMVIKDGKLRCAVLSDGKTLCVYAPPIKKYAQRDAPKTLAEIFQIDEMQIVRQDLNDLLFLDQMNLEDAFDKIMKDVVTLTLEKDEELAGVKVHHLHFSEEQADWDMFVEIGDKPLLRKVSVQFERNVQDATGAPAAAQVQLSASFDDWKINPEVPSERFTFVPPAESKKVESFLQKPEEEGAEYDPKLKGKPAPELAAQILDGEKFDLASQKGKNVVLLDFWATWCGPCRMAMPIVSEVIASYKGKGVVGYAVNLGEDLEKLKEFKKATPELTLPILMDADGKIAEAYRVQPIPMSVLIDKNGVIQQVHLGVDRDLEVFRKKLKTELDTILAGGTIPDEKKAAPEKPADKPADAPKTEEKETPKPAAKKSEKGDEEAK